MRIAYYYQILSIMARLRWVLKKTFKCFSFVKEKVSYDLWLLDLGRFSYSHPIMEYQQI